MPGEHSANQEDYSGDGYKKLKTAALSFILSAVVFLIVRFISENIYAIWVLLRKILLRLKGEQTMRIMTGKERNYTCVSIHAGKISCGKKCIHVSDTRHVVFKFPYDEIIVAYIEVFDKESNTFYRPEITDLTENICGKLVLYDSRFCRFEIYPGKTGKTAGMILKQLAVHAPYIFLSYEPWLEEYDEKQFAEIKEMVSIMKDIPDGVLE